MDQTQTTRLTTATASENTANSGGCCCKADSEKREIASRPPTEKLAKPQSVKSTNSCCAGG